MELCTDNLEMSVYNNEMGGVEIIKNQGPPRFYQHVFPQILKGLDAIHSVGLIHRDISVSNILIANPTPSQIRDIIVKIAEFGLATDIEPELSPLRPFKTLLYYNPERGTRRIIRSTISF